MKKIALVTGASSGIGQAISQRLIALDYKVIGLSRRVLEAQENFMPIQIDITNDTALEKNIKSLLKEYNLDLLVNAAGVGKFEPHEELSLKEIKTIIDTNLTAPLMLSSLCLRSLKKSKGKIINISSIEALKASKFSAVYSATKAGLHHFSSSLFEEVRKSGVTITTIHPDLTQTPFFDNLHFKPKDEKGMALHPDDIAQSVEDILNMNEGVSITEVTIRPQYFGIQKK